MKNGRIRVDILDEIMEQVIKANRETAGSGTKLFTDALKEAELLSSRALNEPIN